MHIIIICGENISHFKFRLPNNYKQKAITLHTTIGCVMSSLHVIELQVW